MVHICFIDDFLKVCMTWFPRCNTLHHLYLLLWYSFTTESHHESQLTPVNKSISILKFQWEQYCVTGLDGRGLTLSKTLNASRISSSWFWSCTFSFIIMRNSGKSIEPVPSLSTVLIKSWMNVYLTYREAISISTASIYVPVVLPQLDCNQYF